MMDDALAVYVVEAVAIEASRFGILNRKLRLRIIQGTSPFGYS